MRVYSQQLKSYSLTGSCWTTFSTVLRTKIIYKKQTSSILYKNINSRAQNSVHRKTKSKSKDHTAHHKKQYQHRRFDGQLLRKATSHQNQNQMLVTTVMRVAGYMACHIKIHLSHILINNTNNSHPQKLVITQLLISHLLKFINKGQFEVAQWQPS